MIILKKKFTDKRVTRRTFITSTGVAVAGTTTILNGCGDDSGSGSGPGTGPGGSSTVRLLARNHFVPAYDTWLDGFAQSWGDQNNATVAITRVPQGDLLVMADDAFTNGDGFDLIEFDGAASAREPDVIDLADINQEAETQWGTQVDLCKRSSLNPTSGKYHSFCPGWTPLPMLYRKSLWETHASMPNGPTTWEELRDGGAAILANSPDGEYIGIGMSDELDSSQSMRAVLYSFGGSIQNENNQITLDSAETRDAITFMQEVHDMAMDTTAEGGDVFNWTASSNNQAIGGGFASLVNNPISAYRTPLLAGDDIAHDIFLTAALPSANHGALTPPCCLSTFVIPNWSQDQGVADLAKSFLMALAGAYDEAVQAAALYNLPAFPNTAPDVATWLMDDPQGSMPADKLSVLAAAGDWSVHLGYPGSANPAVGQIWDEHLLTKLFRRVISEGVDMEIAIPDAVAEMQTIYDAWSDFL